MSLCNSIFLDSLAIFSHKTSYYGNISKGMVALVADFAVILFKASEGFMALRLMGSAFRA